ncbi:hypothetical protein PAMA_015719 [Pampus argenteus]
MLVSRMLPVETKTFFLQFSHFEFVTIGAEFPETLRPSTSLTIDRVFRWSTDEEEADSQLVVPLYQHPPPPTPTPPPNSISKESYLGLC